MSSTASAPSFRTGKLRLRTIILAGAGIVVIAAMALDTKVVKIGSADDVQTAAFSPDAYGASEFPKIQSAVEGRAVPAPKLAEELAKDKNAATKQYGIVGGLGPVFSVSFTGVVGSGTSGIYDVKVDGVPDEIRIRIQTGPAINGTELRDATGTIQFGAFKNQIEYQNAGVAINKTMKEAVLSKVDTANLTGKTVSIVGAFRLINPKNWLVTPVRLDVK